MTDLQAIVDRYFEAWNAHDAAARRAAIADALAREVRYVDPLADVQGHDGFERMVAALQAQYPGHQVRRTSVVEAHHDRARFEWEILDPDGGVLVAGVDYAAVAGDGRLCAITGFFGTTVPAEAAA